MADTLGGGYCATCEKQVPDGEVVGVEYIYYHPDHYDGISEWVHTVCGRREGRWTGRELVGDEDSEPKYGGRR